MKKLLIIILLVTISCNKKLNDNYRGYVYNLKKEPLAGVKVYANRFPLQYTYTHKNGYFLLNRKSENFVDNLVFEKEEYITDTIGAYSANRSRDITHFLTQYSDTIFLEEVKQP